MLKFKNNYINTNSNEFGFREDLMEDLYQRYAGRGVRVANIRSHTNFLLKKYSWIVVTESTYVFKRAIDIVVSLLLLVLLSPLLIITSLAIKMEDRGPVIYSQLRAGKLGRSFTIYKFRSMGVNADSVIYHNHNEETNSDNPVKISDPRIAPAESSITRVGRIIRKTSIDELPQLWNVLKGEMSLVGPRPHVLEEVMRYEYSWRERLNATPGLTCFSQIAGRKDVEFYQQVDFDVQYIESLSVWTDLKILIKTIPAILLSKGAH